MATEQHYMCCIVLLAVTGGVLAPEGAIGNTLISVFISVYTYI